MGKTNWESGNRQMDRRLMLMENFSPWGGCLPLPRGYIHLYYHNNEASSPLANQSQTSYGAFLGRGKESLYKWSRSHDQDGCHGYK